MRDGYKQTEIGEIPEDWDVISLGDYVDITSGESPSKLNLVSSGIPYFKVEQLNYDSKYIRKTPYFFEEGKTVPKGSVIFPKRGASILLNKIRIIAQDSFMDTNLMALTARGELFGEYLFYCLDYMGLVNVADTTSIPQINNKHIKPFKIPLPKKSEQKKIARCLSDADQLISYLEKLIAKKRCIKTGTMQQLLTGRKRLPGFGSGKGYKQTELGEIPEDWNETTIGKVGLFKKGRGIRKDQVKESGNPCVRYGEIYNKHNDYIKDFCSFITDSVALEATKLSFGDLLFSGSGETSEEIGKCVAYVGHEDAYAGGDIIILSPIKQDPKYFGYLMNSAPVVKQKSRMGQGDAVVHIQAANLADVIICLPELKEQEAISTLISDMDKEIDLLISRLGKAKDIKKGMMQELLTGRTRLVEIEAAE